MPHFFIFHILLLFLHMNARLKNIFPTRIRLCTQHDTISTHHLLLLQHIKLRSIIFPKNLNNRMTISGKFDRMFLHKRINQVNSLYKGRILNTIFLEIQTNIHLLILNFFCVTINHANNLPYHQSLPILTTFTILLDSLWIILR